MKRVFAVLLAVVLAGIMQVTAAAYFDGFINWGGWTDTRNRYSLIPDEALFYYNGEQIVNPDYREIFAGTAIYIPIAVEPYTDPSSSSGSSGSSGDDDGGYTYATAKQVKDDKVDVSYKGTNGSAYIQGVTVVDGKKEKLPGLPAGSYAKVQLVESVPSVERQPLGFIAVLSVNNITHQSTAVEFACGFSNRSVPIYEDSVYGARIPTEFRTDSYYNGHATFDMGNGVKYTGRVSPRTRYLIDYNTVPNPDIRYKYPDAHTEFYNFEGDLDTFADTGRLDIPIDPQRFRQETTAEPTVFAYEIGANGQLIALDRETAIYDKATQTVRIHTRALGEYVLSSQMLERKVDENNNPVLQTGYADDPYEPPAQEAVPRPGTTPAPNDTPTITNLGTGGSTINAGNTSGYNPVTGLAMPIGPFALLACAAAAVAFKYRKALRRK